MSTDEDLVPNVSMAPEYDSTYYADIPKERIQEESAEAAVKAASYPIMASVADWFAEQVNVMDSRTAILSYSKAYKVSLEDAGRAFDVARDIFLIKAKEFENYRSEHA